jgi:MraW methylase family
MKYLFISLTAVILLVLLEPMRSFCNQILKLKYAPSLLTRKCSITAAEYGYHIPVMRDEFCNYLMSGVNGSNGVFVDCTVGGGGHTEEILARGGKVVEHIQHTYTYKHTALSLPLTSMLLERLLVLIRILMRLKKHLVNFRCI